jgi:hypothetical protein
MGYFGRYVLPLVKTQKIRAIQAVKTQYQTSLLASKRIVDLIEGGAVVETGRNVDAGMLDSLEILDTCLRNTIREVTKDEETVDTLVAIRQQITELWTELAKLVS